MTKLQGIGSVARWQARADGSTYTDFLTAWAEAADAEDERAPQDDSRTQRWLELRAKAPKRATVDQADVNDCPLFIAANEPRLI